ncbi:hypothetical protein [Microcoleus sp. OTE_8_concoct_300]|uniref:hypothetical protein n=1 Tax=Microcoleus sp. OTE_8_concoct_300 TaxID=2964710 RepID=UPI00403F889F
MKKLLTTTGTAMLLANMTIAPAFADSLAQQTTSRQQQQVVLPEGEMISDAELSEVEGEWKHIAVGAGVGAVGGVVMNGLNNARTGQAWHQNWGSAAVGGAATGGCRAGTGNWTGCGIAGSAAGFGANRAFGW